MWGRGSLSEDDIREIIREELGEFKADLIKEMRSSKPPKIKEVHKEPSPVSTSEVCRRWGKSRTTLCKLVRDGELIPTGKFKREYLYRVSDVVDLFGEPQV